MNLIDDVLSRVRISDVAEALGVELDRTRRRGVAIWRKGKKFSVSFNDQKNCWHDFATGDGGGVVSFAARVLACDSKAALEWLAACAGVPLDHRTEAEKREWSRRMHAAKPQAERLVRWKLETLEGLREQRNRLLRIYHRAIRFITHHDIDECERRGDLRFEAALVVGWSYWPQIRELDKAIDELAEVGYSDLLRRFGMGGAA